MVWNDLQVKQQKREVEMAGLHTAAFMKIEVSPLILKMPHMFVIEVLILLKS